MRPRENRESWLSHTMGLIELLMLLTVMSLFSQWTSLTNYLCSWNMERVNKCSDALPNISWLGPCTRHSCQKKVTLSSLPKSILMWHTALYFKVDKPGIQADGLLCLLIVLANSQFWESSFTIHKIGDFPHFLSAFASNYN